MLQIPHFSCSTGATFTSWVTYLFKSQLNNSVFLKRTCVDKTLPWNGNDAKTISTKLTLIENKLLWLLREVITFLSIYYICMYRAFFLKFSNEDVFITVLWKFLMTAQYEILMGRIIRMAIWNKWFEPARRINWVQLGPLDNNWLREPNCIIRAIIDWMDFILLFCHSWDHYFIISSKTKMIVLLQKPT